MNKPEHPVHVMGTRHGEKLYEALLSTEEMACAEDMGDYFRVPPDGRDLNYAKFVEQGDQKLTKAEHGEDYNSLAPSTGCGRHEETAAEAGFYAEDCAR